MNNTAVLVEGLSKKYRIGRRPTRRNGLVALANSGLSLFRYLASSWHCPDADEVIWALKAINFEVRHGEVVGIIGANGAGKSTLLKILSRITEPSEGRAVINGRVGSLLEVGTGFHPELTGRENIFLNGAIMGMKRAEIKRKFDEIVEFADVAKFIDTPVKRYSSGMYVRLAFAVAAHLEPEILVVDEVLAVGDSAFQKKCLGKMGNFAREGRTVLFVSHNMAAVLDLCQTAYWLDKGLIREHGQTATVIESYLRDARSGEAATALAMHAGRRPGSVPIMRNVRLLRDNQPSDSFECYGNFELEVECVVPKDTLPQLSLGFMIKDSMGFNLFATNMSQHKLVVPNSGEHYAFRATIAQLPLAPGMYGVSLYVGNGSFDIDTIENAISFHVNWNKRLDLAFPPQPYWGPLFVPVAWRYSCA